MVAFRRITLTARLDRIEALIALPSPSYEGPEAAWRATLTPAELEAEDARQAAIIDNATSAELDGLIAAYAVHPAHRGNYLLWPPQATN